MGARVSLYPRGLPTPSLRLADGPGITSSGTPRDDGRCQNLPVCSPHSQDSVSENRRTACFPHKTHRRDGREPDYPKRGDASRRPGIYAARSGRFSRCRLSAKGGAGAARRLCPRWFVRTGWQRGGLRAWLSKVCCWSGGWRTRRERHGTGSHSKRLLRPIRAHAREARAAGRQALKRCRRWSVSGRCASARLGSRPDHESRWL